MKKYTPEQKTKIITRAKEIGTAAAAKENNVPYSTILKWLKDEGVLVSVDLEIKVKENEIEMISQILDEKRRELKELKREREREDGRLSPCSFSRDGFTCPLKANEVT